MSPIAPSQRKRIPLLAAGAIAALGFAVWNVHRALQPPLHTMHPVGSLDRVSVEVGRTLPLPSGEDAPPVSEPAASAPAPAAAAPAPASGSVVAEENLAPGTNPFVPLPGQGVYGQQFVTAAAPSYEAMPTLPPPAYIPEPVTPMRLATATMSLSPRRVQPRPVLRPSVSIRSNEPAFVGPVAPVLPNAAPAPAPKPAPAAPVQVETPPTLVGTLLGDQPSAVFQLNGNIVIVPAGGMVGGWQLLTVEHGQATLKHLATGTKVPILVATGAAPAVQ